MTTIAVQIIQENRCHIQDMMSVLCASALVKFGCKHIHPISNLVAFVSGVEGASFLVIAKSVHTLRTSLDMGERRSAKRALIIAFSAALGATGLKKRYTTVRMPRTFDKPLIITTCAIMALAETEMRAPKWILQSGGGIVDKYFPEPNVVLPLLGAPRPIAQLPEEMRPMKWDSEEIIASFHEGNEEVALLHNMEILLQATECQLARSSEFPTKFYEVLRGMKERVPDLSDWIQLGYCTMQKEEVEEEFYGRSDISVKGIYDAIIWSMMHDTLIALPEGNKEQLQLLVDLIPVHLKDNREVNRTRTKVWFVVSKIQGLDLMLGLKLRTLNDKIKGATGTAYLKSDGCDLGLLRRAAKELLAI